MIEDTDPILEAVTALRAEGVKVEPIGVELDRWRVGDFEMGDADVWRLVASRGLVEADEPR
jgi:hypothetical protein